LLRDTPRQLNDIPVCLSRAAYHGRDESTCASPRDFAVDDKVFEVEQAAAIGLRYVSFLDMSDSICGPELCEPVRDGMVVHRDGAHLTATYVTALAPELSRQLASLLDRPAFNE
jgi:hypothetical protein